MVMTASLKNRLDGASPSTSFSVSVFRRSVATQYLLGNGDLHISTRGLPGKDDLRGC